MSKKEEFMTFIEEMKKYENPSNSMVNFLIDTIDICLTEERVTSKDFLSKMVKLTDKYIEEKC